MRPFPPTEMYIYSLTFNCYFTSPSRKVSLYLDSFLISIARRGLGAPWNKGSQDLRYSSRTSRKAEK